MRRHLVNMLSGAASPANQLPCRVSYGWDVGAAWLSGLTKNDQCLVFLD